MKLAMEEIDFTSSWLDLEARWRRNPKGFWLVLCLPFLAGFGSRWRRDGDLVVVDEGATRDARLKKMKGWGFYTKKVAWSVWWIQRSLVIWVLMCFGCFWVSGLKGCESGIYDLRENGEENSPNGVLLNLSDQYMNILV